MPATRRCPRCRETYPLDGLRFYIRPGNGVPEYCIVPSHANGGYRGGCHGQYWDQARERRRQRKSARVSSGDTTNGRKFGVEVESASGAGARSNGLMISRFTDEGVHVTSSYEA